MMSTLVAIWKKQWGVVLLFLFSSFFLSCNLSGQGLSLDEPQTMMIVRGIQQFGFPSSWDGRNLVSDANGLDSLKLGENYIWTWHPPLQTYVTYVFVTLFGNSVFVARFPFVLFGAGTIILIYLLTQEVFRNRFVSILVSLQLLFLLPFFLYVRQARYYSPSIFFSFILFYIFLSYGKKKWGRGRWTVFFITTVLLGLTNYFVFGTCMVCFGVVAILQKDKKMLLFLGLLGILGIIFFSAIHPFGGSILNTHANKSFLSSFLTNLSYINVWVFPFLLLPFIWLGLRKKKSLLFPLSVWIGVKLLMYSFVQPHGRFLVDLIPVFVFLYGFLYEWVERRLWWGMVFVIFSVTVLTNMLTVLPYKVVGDQKQFLFYPSLYKSELIGEYENDAQAAAQFLSTHTKKGSLIWSNNYRWSIIYYGSSTSISPLCNHNTGQFLGPKAVSDPNKISAFVFFKDDIRLPQTLSNLPCFGKQWQEKMEKEYTKIVLPTKNVYAVNDVDMVNRQFPPPVLKQGIVIYLKK